MHSATLLRLDDVPSQDYPRAANAKFDGYNRAHLAWRLRRQKPRGRAWFYCPLTLDRRQFFGWLQSLFGANAIMYMRYDATELMASMTEVLCYGTPAVVQAEHAGG
jgi:hypothetical protein